MPAIVLRGSFECLVMQCLSWVRNTYVVQRLAVSQHLLQGSVSARLDVTCINTYGYNLMEKSNTTLIKHSIQILIFSYDNTVLK